MEHAERNVSAGFYWYDRPLDVGGYLTWLRGLVAVLRVVDARFASTYVLDAESGSVVTADDVSLGNAFYASLSREVAYENEDSRDATLHPTSKCLLGFESSFVTNLRGPGYSVAVSAGKQLPKKANSVVINISEEIASATLARKLFAEVVSYCKPMHANMNRVEVDDLLAQRPGDVYAGALTFLTKPGAEQFLPSDVHTYRLGDGLLIDVDGEFPYAAEESGVLAIRKLIEALRPHGFLTNPKRLAG